MAARPFRERELLVKRTVTVLQDDIDHGQRRSPSACALARAIRRDLADLMAEHDVVSVAPGSAAVLRPSYEMVSRGLRFEVTAMTLAQVALVRLPFEATEFIGRFDGKQPVEPFKFEAEVQA